MSVWKKRRTRAATGETSGLDWPVELEVVTGKLTARVYLHTIASPTGPLTCWSYVSNGLTALEQSEVVFTLLCDRGETSDDFPPDPLHLLATIYQLAEGGQRVGPGDVTGFTGRLFFGHHLLYVGALPLDGVPLPPSCLAALLITAEELRAVADFGSTRVLARMGQASGHYPFPPWSDRHRRGLSLAESFEQSLLSEPIPRAASPDVRASVVRNQIIVSALRGASPSWHDRLGDLPDNVPIALLTSFDPTADGCLVWVPGQSAPQAITPPGGDGARLCSCFVVVIPGQPNNIGRIREDGVTMELTAAAWHEVRSALIQERDVSISAAGDGMSLNLSWRDQGLSV